MKSILEHLKAALARMAGRSSDETLMRQFLDLQPGLVDGLSFAGLRLAMIARIMEPSNAFKKCEDTWTTAHWMQALVGEVGELANILKKVDRGDFTLESALESIGKEFGDIVAYLDILAFKVGINLGQVTADKYNEVSERIGSSLRIELGDTSEAKLGGDFYQALGWMHAHCCSLLDEGKDPRQENVPQMVQQAIHDLLLGDSDADLDAA